MRLTQGYEWVDTDVNNGNTFDNTLTVNDSVLTSGSYTELQTSGFYSQSDKPSDYGNISAAGTQADDIALSVVASATADNAMKTHAVFNNSTITGDVAFVSTFDENYYVGGHDSNADGVVYTNGWDDTDELNLTLDNGSKWVGAAISNVQMDSALYNRSTNSIWPYSVFSSTNGYLVGDDVYQSGLFNVALNNGSEWDTTKSSNIDDLTVNNRSQVNVVESALLADHISLTNASTLKIAAHGGVKTDVLNLNSGSQAISPYGTLAYVYEDANNDANINGDRIDNGVDGSAVRVGLGGQFDMSKNFTVYAGANYLGGSDVDQPWAANLGMKYRW